MMQVKQTGTQRLNEMITDAQAAVKAAEQDLKHAQRKLAICQTRLGALTEART